MSQETPRRRQVNRLIHHLKLAAYYGLPDDCCSAHRAAFPAAEAAHHPLAPEVQMFARRLSTIKNLAYPVGLWDMYSEYIGIPLGFVQDIIRDMFSAGPSFEGAFVTELCFIACECDAIQSLPPPGVAYSC